MPGVEERIGTRLAGYRIERLIGQGGMGMVFLAEHVHLGRKVALKILPPSLAADESFRKRFVRESQLAAGIEHPNVIPVYDAGEAEGELFIAMKYVEGTDLRALIDQRGRLESDHTLDILRQVGSALDAAHREGLVHRDVKPGNILITPAGHVFLTDFGLTKRTAAQSSVTATGFFVGTMSYAPPEQIQGHPLDGRTDQYSLACVAFECLTGRVPFVREPDVAVLYAHLKETPPPASEFRPDLPEPVDTALAKAMAKSPDDRFGSCSALVEALRAGMREPARPGVVPAAIPPVELPTLAGPRASAAQETRSSPQARPTEGIPSPQQTRPAPEDTARTAEPTVAAPDRAPHPPTGPRPRRRAWPYVAVGTVLLAAAATYLVVGPLSTPQPVDPTPPDGNGSDGNGGPAGERIVFLRPGLGDQLDVLTMAADGSDRQLLNRDIASGTTPSWSPDRKHIVFDGEGEGDSEIYKLRARPGGKLEKLTDNTVADAAPAWSPDGEAIAFESDRDGDFDIWLMNPDGTGQRKLLEVPGNQTRPAWSPDGSMVVFEDDRSGDSDIWIVDLVDAEGKTDLRPLVVDPAGDDGAPAWSPDASTIAYRSNRDGNLEIYSIPADGGDVQRLTTTDADERAPTWSPDGSKILFHRLHGDMDIWIMDPDGTDQEAITKTPEDEFGASF